MKKKIASAVALTGLEATMRAGVVTYHKTLGKSVHATKRMYWQNRAYVLDEEIKECPSCTANSVKIGYKWEGKSAYSDHEIGVGKEYCPEHAEEVKKIILNYNSMV